MLPIEERNQIGLLFDSDAPATFMDTRSNGSTWLDDRRQDGEYQLIDETYDNLIRLMPEMELKLNKEMDNEQFDKLMAGFGVD